ncbi:hypothetical protein [Pseudomonas fluorescens]|uniref:hypothetical protein n=1 Tax=Pseudomonas fluorescens TaxID=294 RepID=UPI00123FCBAF|nr:hypothetical protein [Pseudomonas fluorescens]
MPFLVRYKTELDTIYVNVHGPFPKDEKISLCEMAALQQSWNEVATVIRGVDIVHGKTVSLNVVQLFELGESLNLVNSSPGALTAQAAVPRLA